MWNPWIINGGSKKSKPPKEVGAWKYVCNTTTFFFCHRVADWNYFLCFFLMIWAITAITMTAAITPISGNHVSTMLWNTASHLSARGHAPLLTCLFQRHYFPLPQKLILWEWFSNISTMPWYWRTQAYNQDKNRLLYLNGFDCNAETELVNFVGKQ